jgi:hypothetical protein
MALPARSEDLQPLYKKIFFFLWTKTNNTVTFHTKKISCKKTTVSKI